MVEGKVCIEGFTPGGGGGALRFESVPTAKGQRAAEAVNAKIQRWSTRFGAKKGGGQL